MANTEIGISKPTLTLIYIAGGIALAAGAFFGAKALFKKIKDSDGSRAEGKDDREGIKAAEKKIDTANLSMSKDSFKNMADRLYVAMKGSGTNEDTVISVIKRLKNEDDWLALYAQFGIKKVDTWAYDFSGNLTKWLEDEMSTSGMKEVSDHLNKLGVGI